ncbi:uncharacterized protein LOC144432691 [Glandiceps talaboti]
MFSLMGNCFVWIKERREPPRKVTIALVGLDNAGKTTALKGVQGESLDVAPTVGFSSAELKLEKFLITVYDLGGGQKIRGIWKNYYAESHAVVFVIDAADQDRLDESKETLKMLLSNPKVKGKPLLVLANKQDQEGALDEIDICEQLSLEDMVNESRSPCRVETCSATIGIGKKMDKSIKAGFKWLLLTIGEEWDELSPRVEQDSQEQREREAQEKKERMERVRKIREEREREEEERRKKEGIEKEDSEDDDDDVHVDKNPFKPVDTIKFDTKKKKPKKEPKKQQKLPEDSEEDQEKRKHKSYVSDDDDEIPVSRKTHKSPKLRRRKSPSRKHRNSDEDEDEHFSTPKSTPRSRTKKPVMRSFYLSDSDDDDEVTERRDEVDFHRQNKDSDEDGLSDSHLYRQRRHSDEDVKTDKRFHKQKKKRDKDIAMDTYFGRQSRDSEDSDRIDRQFYKQRKDSDDDVAMDTYFGKQNRDSDDIDGESLPKSPRHYRSPRTKIIHVTSEEDDDEGIEVSSYSSKKSKDKAKASLWQHGRAEDDEDSMIVQMRKEVAEESEKKKKKKKKVKKKNKLAPMPLDAGDDMIPPPLPAPLPLPSWAQPPAQRNSLASRAPRLAPLMEKNSPRTDAVDSSFGATNWGLAEDLPELPRRTKPNTDEDDEIMT